MRDDDNAALNLIDTVAAQPQLSTFSQILTASGIAEIFIGGGEFTIFAPNDDAFRKLDPSRLLALLQDPDRTHVRTLVLMHVCMGRMEVGTSAAPIDEAAPVHLSSTCDTFEQPDIRKRNIVATNGLIHEIGTVLTPASSPCIHGH